MASRAVWNVADQGISSLTNAALTVLVARSVGADAFGTFALSFTVYSLLVGASRALIAGPIGVRFSGATPDEYGEAARAATGASAVYGLLAGVVVAMIAMTLRGGVGGALLAMAVVLPGLMAQDTWRFVFISRGRPAAAVVNDVFWGAVQFAGIGWLLVGGVKSASPLVLAWGLAGTAAAAFGAFQLGAWPRPTHTLKWVRGQWDLGGYFLGTYVAVIGAAQLSLILVGALGGVRDLGALRAAQVVLGPVTLVGVGAVSFAVPEISRRGVLSRRTKLLIAGSLSGALVLVTLAWGILALAIPARIGTMVVGSTWARARLVLPAAVADAVVTCVAVGPVSVLHATGQVRRTFRVHILAGVLFLILTVVGFEMGGVVGAAIGFAVAEGAVVPLFWVQLWRAPVLEQATSGEALSPPGHGPEAQVGPNRL